MPNIGASLKKNNKKNSPISFFSQVSHDQSVWGNGKPGEVEAPQLLTSYLSFFFFFFLPWLTCCHFILQIALLYLSAGRPQLTNKNNAVGASRERGGDRETFAGKSWTILMEGVEVGGVLKGGGGGSGGPGGVITDGATRECSDKFAAPLGVSAHFPGCRRHLSTTARKPITNANKNMAWDSVRNFCAAPADR